jgi:hypothetical protein
MGQTLQIVAGSDRSWGTTLKNAAGVALAFDPADPLDAAVWAGGDVGAPTIFRPSVAWVSAPDGTVSLTVAAAQTATLDPGVYKIHVGVTAGGARAIGFDGQLEVLPAPGTATLGTPYCTFADMLLYYDQVGTLANRRADEANFLGQRMRAKTELDRMIILRYGARSGMVLTRRNTFDPILQTFDVPTPSAAAPSKAQLTAYLNAGGLIAEDLAREMTAKWAIAFVLERQTTASGRNPYPEEAERFRQMAMAIWRCYQAQIDTSDPLDGVADLLIGRDVIILPPGTAP